MKKEYVWDTEEQQGKDKPYDFVPFPDKFLKVYLEKRKNHIEDIQKNLSKTNITQEEAIQIILRFPKFFEDIGEGWQGDRDGTLIETYQNPRELEEINVPRMIRTIYEQTYTNGRLENEVMNTHMNKIIKKVEVRKLRKGYNRNFINTTKDPIEIEDFGYLALTLGINSGNNLQALSTMLKINDYILSRVDELKTGLELTLAYISLMIEKEQIEKLSKLRGVSE